MLKEQFRDYLLEGAPQKTPDGRFLAGVKIYRLESTKKSSPALPLSQHPQSFFLADDNIRYILEVEAAKEGINLGKRLIEKNLC